MKEAESSSEDMMDGVISSLYYLYQEALRINQKALADIIQKAIENGNNAIVKSNTKITSESQNLLMEFYLLREFRSYSVQQKKALLEEMQKIQVAD